MRGTRIVVGAHAVIDSFVKVKPAGGMGDLLIGEHVVINAGCVLYTGNGIRIGNHVAIAANCTFAPVNHAFEDRGRLIREQGFLPSKGGIVIEDDVWIGANCVLLDGADVTEEIATPLMSQAASKVSAVPAVRRALVAQQQTLGRAGGVVMEGRDIGTQVFPNADVKIYLDATSAARAQRRHTDELTKGINSGSLLATQAEIEERDHRDKTRADSPLVQAEDAIYLDSSGLTVEEVLAQILELVTAKGL